MTKNKLYEVIEMLRNKNHDTHTSWFHLDEVTILRGLSYLYRLPCLYRITRVPEFKKEVAYKFLYTHDMLYYYDDIVLLKDPSKISNLKQTQHDYKKVYIIAPTLYNSLKELYHLYYELYHVIQKIDITKKSDHLYQYHFEFMSQLFSMALYMRASDIHFIKTDENGDILFRIQGHRTFITSIEKNVMDHFIRRLKVLANLEINNQTDAQDGTFIWENKKFKESYRLATMITPHGEQMILRKVEKEENIKSLDMLGLKLEQTKYLKQHLHKKQGFIIVSGTTGSGKTTTLYACLKALKQKPVHILTIEDPVEMNINHISQLQLDSQKKILKHIMRYDPDVIMIGEIRDDDSARAAIEAALSGHLVLASIHVNHPHDLFNRMQQFNIDPKMLEDTSPMILHHHLIPILCQNCLGRGCIHCAFKGYDKRQLLVDMKHYINHQWIQKGDAIDISLKQLLSKQLIDQTTFEQFQLEL